jgi:hypothetical protein
VVEDRVTGLFDELRTPLLRYLTGFPLTLQDSEDRVAHNLALKKHLRSRKDFENAGPLVAVEQLVAYPAPHPEGQFAFNERQERLLSVVRARLNRTWQTDGRAACASRK